MKDEARYSLIGLQTYAFMNYLLNFRYNSYTKNVNHTFMSPVNRLTIKGIT
jgi:hypothetical protein